MLPCCEKGGCWASRVVPLGDGDPKDYTNLCSRPTKTPSGKVIPKCLDLISVEDVVKAVRGYLRYYNYNGEEEGWVVEK
jgi:hypothetical protein